MKHVNILVEPLALMWRNRTRLREGIGLDLRAKYSGSVLGLVWAFLFPAMQLAIYTGLYTVIFRIRPAGLTEFGYVLLVFSGLVPLLAFSEALTTSIGSLASNKSLLLSTIFPAELIPLRAILAGQLPMLFGLGITMALGFGMGHSGWEAIVLVPVFWILMLMFAAGLGWIMALFTLVARDLQQGIGLILMLLVFLSPFAYTPEMVPSTIKAILYLNPLSYFVLSFQQLICYGTLPELIPALGSAVLGIVTFYFGFWLFQRTKHTFFDFA